MITVDIPPALYRSLSGQLHLVSGCHWLPVPDGTTLADAGLYMTLESPLKPSSCDDPLTDSKAAQSDPQRLYEVAGSKGQTYLVEGSGDSWTCTCKGFKFRRRCRHITTIRETNQ